MLAESRTTNNVIVFIETIEAVYRNARPGCIAFVLIDAEPVSLDCNQWACFNRGS
jgi:hypothetical protein